MASRAASDAADRLLSGRALPEPDGSVSEVALLLAALRSPTESDGVREQEAVAAFAGALLAAPTRLDDVTTGKHARRHTARIAVATAAFVLVGGTAAAAATGSLPDGAQSEVSKALAHVSVDVPNPDGPHHAATDHRGSVGPDATGPAQRGLCTAWAAHDRADAERGTSADATAFANLRRAAQDDGLPVKDFCADVLDGTTTPDAGGAATTDPGQAGVDHGQSGVDHGQSGVDHGQSGVEHGQSGVEHGRSGVEHGQSGDHPVHPPDGNGQGKPADTSSTTKASQHSGS